MGEKGCKHKYIHLDTSKWTTSEGYNLGFYRKDRFFCEKCLEQKVIEKHEYSRDTPDWYK